ncbi:hypothetical protein BDV33DRAFT_184674, partial [Aspergillus novoparasiticus]
MTNESWAQFMRVSLHTEISYRVMALVKVLLLFGVGSSGMSPVFRYFLFFCLSVTGSTLPKVENNTESILAGARPWQGHPRASRWGEVSFHEKRSCKAEYAKRRQVHYDD